MRIVEPNDEIISTAKVTVPEEHRRELCLTISDLLKMIRKEAGCRSYGFYEEKGDQCSFLLIGAWETREAWDQHLNSNNFAVLLGSLKLLCDLSCVDFKLLAHVKSIEATTRVRCEPFKEAVPFFIT